MGAALVRSEKKTLGIGGSCRSYMNSIQSGRMKSALLVERKRLSYKPIPPGCLPQKLPTVAQSEVPGIFAPVPHPPCSRTGSP